MSREFLDASKITAMIIFERETKIKLNFTPFLVRFSFSHYPGFDRYILFDMKPLTPRENGTEDMVPR